MRLYCLAPAGGSARSLAAALGRHAAGFVPVPVDRPGRGTRWRETSGQDWPGLLADLSTRLVGELDSAPYGLFGHSLGALVGYELAHRLQDLGHPAELLVLAGRNPPWAGAGPELWQAADLPDEELFARLVALGGADARGAGPLTYRTFLPALRADLRLARAYRSGPRRQRLTARLVVLHGTDDPLTSPVAVARWAEVTSGGSLTRTVRGGHFFPLRRPADVARIVSSTVASLTRPAP